MKQERDEKAGELDVLVLSAQWCSPLPAIHAGGCVTKGSCEDGLKQGPGPAAKPAGRKAAGAWLG